MSLEADRDAILARTQQLLVAVTAGDWEAYEEICDPSLTCFEHEALGNLVDGLDFHHYYFNLPGGSNTPIQSTMIGPHIRIIGDVGIIAYIRLTQKIVDGKPTTSAMEETRIWHRQSGKWKHVHFHRSPAK
jgi:calcium/calmodulin-dependent protein kinase (CaM kinase) II